MIFLEMLIFESLVSLAAIALLSECILTNKSAKHLKRIDYAHTLCLMYF